MRRADIAIAGVNRTTECNWGSWKSEAIVSRLTVTKLIELRRIRNWALGHMKEAKASFGLLYNFM